MADTNTSVAGCTLESYVCNASGPRSEAWEDLHALGQSGSAAIIMKSATPYERPGNIEPRCFYGDGVAVQSMGLPNKGIDFYARMSHELKHIYDKPIIASIAGISMDDYLYMLEKLEGSLVDLVEMNASCPNIEGKRQLGYDPDGLSRLLSSTKDSKLPLGLKLPPYHEQQLAEDVVQAAAESGASFLSTSNSAGASLVIDADTQSTVLAPNNGLGGLSGRCMKPIGLGNVWMLYNAVSSSGHDISIMGVGGISSGKDAFEYLLAGADAVQIGVQYETEGRGSFSRIDSELSDILDEKGYGSVADAKGNLRLP